MTRFMLVLVAVLVAAISKLVAPAMAGKISDMDVSATAGNWELRTEVDGFTDKKTCVIVVKGDHSIQAASNALFISLEGKGGVGS